MLMDFQSYRKSRAIRGFKAGLESFRNRVYEGTKSSKALYDYKALHEEELSFTQGDLINVLERTGDANQWWVSRLHRKVRLIPGRFSLASFMLENTFDPFEKVVNLELGNYVAIRSRWKKKQSLQLNSNPN